MNNKHIVLSGSFSVGKSSLINEAREHYGDKYNYIEDGARKVLHIYFPEKKLGELNDQEYNYFQRKVLDWYLHQEKIVDPSKVTISDGSLIEVAAYGSLVFSKEIQDIVMELLEDRIRSRMYSVIKLPVGTFAVEQDGERHEDNKLQYHIDNRIQAVLNSYIIDQISISQQVDGIKHRFSIIKTALLNLEHYGSLQARRTPHTLNKPVL